MKYILTSNKLEGKILFQFAENGILMSFKVDESDVNEKLIKWLLSHLPFHEKAMRGHPFTTIFKVEMIHPDLSFKAFWNAYNYKIGNKKRAEKLWKALTEPERALAMSAVVKYKRFLSTKKQDKAYAETFLSQRRFENQY